MSDKKLLDRVREVLRRFFSTYRTVQELLGHADVKSTMIYTHGLNKGGRGLRSPLDIEYQIICGIKKAR